RDDIPPLVAHFLARFNQRHGTAFTVTGAGTLRPLVEHDWPGNVRELENTLEALLTVAQAGGGALRGGRRAPAGGAGRVGARGPRGGGRGPSGATSARASGGCRTSTAGPASARRTPSASRGSRSGAGWSGTASAIRSAPRPVKRAERTRCTRHIATPGIHRP